MVDLGVPITSARNWKIVKRQLPCSVFQRIFQGDDTEITRSGLRKRLDYHGAEDIAERRRVMLIILTATTIIANTYCTYLPGTDLKVFCALSL